MKGEHYMPSNGTEGMGFMEHYCGNCIHEKFMHTNRDGDKQCEVLNRCFFNAPDPQPEWIYDENDQPICTEFKKFDWGRDDDENGLNEPPEPPTDDPNQLCLPFLFDELEIKKYDHSTPDRKKALVQPNRMVEMVELGVRRFGR